MSGVVFCDLDSTLADTRHRWHMILRGEDRHKTDWEAYSMACADDGVIESTRRLLDSLDEMTYIVIVTGRHEAARALTEKWLDDNGIRYHELLMRSKGDWRSNVEYKWDKIQKWLAPANGPDEGFEFLIDDFGKVRDYFEERGFPVVTVTPYEFTGDAS